MNLLTPNAFCGGEKPCLLRAENTGFGSKMKIVIWCSCFMVCLAIPPSVQVLQGAALIGVSELRPVGCFLQPIANSCLRSRSSNWSIFLKPLLCQDTSVILVGGMRTAFLNMLPPPSRCSLGTTDLDLWDICVSLI